MRSRFVRALLACAAIAVIGLLTYAGVQAAIGIPTGSPYSQSFDSIGTTATATLPTDFKADRVTTVRTVGTFAAAGTVTTQVGGANLSSSASNGIYNFGAGTTTTGPDRAIGFLSSGTATQSGNLYAQLTNTSGSTLSGLQISYDVEKYRQGINPAGFRIQLFYSTDGTTWTSAGASFLTSFGPDPGPTNIGYATAPGVTVNVSNTLSVQIPKNTAFYLAWNYSVSANSTTTNAQALAIDNVSILGIPAGTTNPLVVSGTADPASLTAGEETLLTVVVAPGESPDSTGIIVTGDLSSVAPGVTAAQFLEGPANTFTYTVTVDPATTGGSKSLPITVTDAEGRSANPFSVPLHVVSNSPIVISQIYGGGGNADAPYKNDYVELYNRTDNPVDVTGWTIQYGSATGNTWNNRQPIGGPIEPHSYYLVALASGGDEGIELPEAPNISGGINMSATAGKVALVDSGDPLDGQCPLGNAHVKDFVGYGTTANCFEGSTRAPAPSNTTAIFRKDDGATDTDQNGADFVVAAPNARRTTPIVEIGPVVVFTEPSFNDTNVPRDGTIQVSFSEPVDVVGAWFTLTCATSGQHSDTTFAVNGNDRYITPNVNFVPGETCTVTLFKDQISDSDTDDSGPGTDHLPANYTWSFLVAAASVLPYTPDVHLTMGNPTGAVADVNQPANYLMSKPEYALSYNRDLGRPNWVSWHLTPEWYGSLTRVDTFRPDPAVPADWYRVQSFDFQFSGFDRGHMVPNADRDGQIAINQATYLMSNMIAQAPDNNQGPWANLENHLRSLTDAGNEIYVVSGPAGTGGTGSDGFAATIADGHVTVPADTWKVALVLPKQSGDDVSRVTCEARTIAVIMPNTQGIRTNPNVATDWMNYLTTVDAVETLTGYEFFSSVPPTIQNCIEAGVNGSNPQSQVITFEPIAQQQLGVPDFAADATASSNLPVTLTVVSGPAAIVNGLIHLTGTGTVTIRASQAGNVGAPGVPVAQTFAAAVPVDRTFTVVDTIAPSMSAVTATPGVLRVPNHKMIDVTLDYTVSDASQTTCAVTVTSNEAPNGPDDGNTPIDWIVVDDHHVQLRAERAGTGSGRIYTITVTCTDASGNVSSQQTTVAVPK